MYLWVIICQARGVSFPRVFHDPIVALQFGRLFNDLHLFSFSFKASQVHGNTDTPGQLVLQKSVRSTGGTRLTKENYACIINILDQIFNLFLSVTEAFLRGGPLQSREWQPREGGRGRVWKER